MLMVGIILTGDEEKGRIFKFVNKKGKVSSEKGKVGGILIR